MTSWTLDNTTFHYWTLNETGDIVWGYPKHGDEVIIDDRFKYIFRATKKEPNFTTWTSGGSTIHHRTLESLDPTDTILTTTNEGPAPEGWEEISYTSSGFTPTNYNRDYVIYTGQAGADAFRDAMSDIVVREMAISDIIEEFPTSLTEGQIREISATVSQNPGEEVVLSNIRYNVIEPTNDLVSDHVDDQANEISAYMREAQQMMNNGR